MIEALRAIVRPLITLTGWIALLWMVNKLVDKFATPDTANLFIGAFLGSVATFIAFWFNERAKGKV